MKRFLLAFTALLTLAVGADAQQTVWVPFCSGTNDTAAFSNVIAAIGANAGTLRLPYKNGTRCAVNTLNIPANVTLDNTDGTGVWVNTGQTLTVNGPRVNPDSKTMFFNVGHSQGNVVITGGQNLTSANLSAVPADPGNPVARAINDTTNPITISVAGVTPIGASKLIDVTNSGSADLDAIWQAGQFKANWTGSGSANHATLISVDGQATHSGTGRVDVAQAVSGIVTNNGTGVLQEPRAFFGQIFNSGSIMGQGAVFTADWVQSGASSSTTYAALFQGKFRQQFSGSPNAVKVHGLYLTGWLKSVGTITYSSGIEIDDSTRIGTEAWAIHSTSLAPSLFSGPLNLAGSTSGTVTIQPKAAAGTWTLTLPDTAGANGSTLQTDGTGVTSWAVPMGGTWHPQGTVLMASAASDEGNVFEPTVIFESSPQILTGCSSVRKKWFTSGWFASDIHYAESCDGIHWTRAASPVVTSHYRSYVYKSGSTYYLFAATFGQAQIDLYTASVSSGPFTLAQAAVITASGAADELKVANCSVFLESGTWYMLYDQLNAVGFTEALATASAPGGPWTKQGTVMSFAGGTVGGPSKVVKVNSTYYVWMIRTPTGTGTLPSDIYRYSATVMAGPWTALADSALSRTADDEGTGTAVGQLADPTGPIEIDGKSYMYTASSADGSAVSGWQHIKLFTADMPISQLVTTSEGINVDSIGLRRPDQPNFGKSPFLSVTYENSWVDYDADPFVGAGFFKDSLGFVHLRGGVKNGTVGAVRVFRLPVGSRPEKTLIIQKPTYQINIYLDGSVEVVSGSNAAVFLDGITFMAYF